MKNLFTKMLVITALFLFGGSLMTSCTPDSGLEGGNGKASLQIGTPNVISAIQVEIPLTTSGLTSVGYKLVEVPEGGEPTAPANAMLLYRSGKKVEGNPSMITLTGEDGLVRGKSFVVYFAAAISDSEFYNNGEILSVEFTTPDNYADPYVNVIRKSNEGAVIEVQIPEEVKNAGRRIKWGVTNLAMIGYNGFKSMPEMLHSCDEVYPAYLFKNDTTLNINHHNVYRRNANDEIGYYIIGVNPDGSTKVIEVDANDPRVETGEAAPIQYYYHFQPGEPLVVMMSEVDYTDCDEYFKDENHYNNNDCDKKHPTIDYGWGPGWYWYPFDFEAYKKALGGDREPGELPMPGVGGGNAPTVDADQFWLEGAWHRQIEIRLPEPEKFDSSVKVEVSKLSPDGGLLTFTPDEDTFAYFMGVFEETNEYKQGYIDLVSTYLGGDPSLMQWFTTSEMAPYFTIFPYYNTEGVVELPLEEYFVSLTPNLRYHIVVNAVPGKMQNGEMIPDVSKQNYQHITFTIPSYTLDAPELEVTAYESNSPWKVKFNIKNANPSIPVEKVVWVANYARDFDVYMSALGYTYTDMVMMNNGVTNLNDAALQMVNSDFGYDLEFDVRAGSTFRLAAMGWNSESRPSDPDKEGSKAWADATSLEEPNADPLDMTKLNALKGDWTATATVKTVDYNTGLATESQRSWKVSIGGLNENATLTAEEIEYLAGFGVTEEAAKAYLAEFNEMSTDYNAKVLGQNRVLCLGWQIDDTRELKTASPWDLFLMPDYNASQVDYLFSDFGPKWFLQTDAEGNIFIPVNYDRVPQLTRWYNGLSHYLCGGNYEKAIANYISMVDPESVQLAGIPVEISADGNTVTLKSYTVKGGNNEDVDLYPNVLYDNNGGLYFYNAYIVSEVVLTKGWTEPAAPAKLSTRNLGKVNGGKRVANDAEYKTPAKTASRTVFAPGTKKVEAKTITRKFNTPEETHKGMEALLKRRQPAIRK